ncbi:class I SAM-dependent methyltransferase [Oscillatoria sp. FACHB-1406]|uniref:class I SAM-dependent methyltransferase n=1 Tax=Oscillatoria sp. FACHB-1406 TaxID=2692846 RepID=UPI0016892558|nr:class I SAM-dependent methyltransferase [Oscillatoria sp. FACHB-1406]MBD2579450.1 methyltransferase domain-containing protein [Oscillatoria sp. FACHB-1406]
MNNPEQNPTWYEQFMATCSPQQRENLYGTVAQLYDRVRPRYPENLIQRATSQLPPNATILEIGCGPGTATVEFAELGYMITALEPSPEASQLARYNCRTYPNVEILTTTLEAWELQPQSYDTIVAATSFHWVSPEVGYPKIAAALKPHGSLILLWNSEVQPRDEIYQQLRSVYLARNPDLARFHDEHRQERDRDLAKFGQAVLDSGYFDNLSSEQQQCRRTYTIEDYLALLQTYSPYIRLEARERELLLADLRTALESAGLKSLPTSFLSVLQLSELKH